MKKGQAPTRNVQVCVRLRPLLEKEGKESIKCVKNDRTITIKGKVYGPFDQVFPESTLQPEVYEKVAKKNVELVLSGYNCTIFAYGQTGTGKTYCMEGGADKAYSGNWKTDPHLGIIPRAMEHIFDTLTSEGVEEYCVRVSYLELYNEELFDLLAANHEEGERLRLYEDPIKKGSVIINGVEEVPVQTKEEVFKVLQRGAERKRMAATLINNRSSRSHCVFIVNVVTRETTLEGEELVRQGKLNLVDLAGSESIGRSGAAGIRAKEAGNINQSLLTLGRCITALTTNGGHVPYRESKLTRLLQDSLGGSTVTTIISTISPSSTSFEETISTLEYSSRAKNIKNHPEINEKLSRKDMLKEMSKAIEKLQRDLRAAREKNGIHVSEESYNGMEERIRDQQQTIEDLTEKLEATMHRCNLMLEDMALMDEQYRILYERRMAVEDRLRKRVDEVQSTKMELLDSQNRATALQSSLDMMHEVALKLRFQAEELQRTAILSSMDLEGVWDKLEDVVTLSKTNYSVSDNLMTLLKTKVTTMQEATGNEKSTSKLALEGILARLGDHQAKIAVAETNFEKNANSISEEICADLIEMNERLKEADKEFITGCTSQEKHMRQYEKDLQDAIAHSRNMLDDFVLKTKESYAELANERCKIEQRIEEMMADEKKRLDTIDLEHSQFKEEHCMMVNTMKQQIDQLLANLSSSVQRHFETNNRQKEDRAVFHNSMLSSINEHGSKIGQQTAQSEEALRLYGDSQHIQIGLLETLGQKEIASTSSDVQSLKELFNNSNKETSEKNENIEQCHHRLKKGEESFVNTTKDIMQLTLNSIDSTIHEQDERNDAFHKFIDDECKAIHGLAVKHVENDLQQITSKGSTPVKRRYDVIDECEHVPRKEKLLKQYGYGVAPRKSLYYTRESILNATINIESPSTMSAARKVAKMDETNESSGSEQREKNVLKTINE